MRMAMGRAGTFEGLGWPRTRTQVGARGGRPRPWRTSKAGGVDVDMDVDGTMHVTNSPRATVPARLHARGGPLRTTWVCTASMSTFI